MRQAAGPLRHVITLQRDEGAADSAGEVVPSWTRYARVRAAIRGSGGSEVDRAEQRTAVGRVAFQIRYHSDVTPQHRVVWGSRTFSIENVVDTNGMKRWLEITCAELL